MRKTLQPRKIFAVFFCLLCLTAALAEAASAAEGRAGDRLFLLSPTVNWYFPTAGKAKSAFGNSWNSFGIAVNLEALGWEASEWRAAGFEIHPYLGYFRANNGDNGADVIPLGLDARWKLAPWGVVNPYVGLGVAGYGVRLEDHDAEVDTGWKSAFGGRLTFGADITRWFNVQAAYNLISDVEGYDISGFSLQGKFKIYF
jgi:hypothetical protein